MTERAAQHLGRSAAAHAEPERRQLAPLAGRAKRLLKRGDAGRIIAETEPVCRVERVGLGRGVELRGPALGWRDKR